MVEHSTIVETINIENIPGFHNYFMEYLFFIHTARSIFYYIAFIKRPHMLSLPNIYQI